MEVGIKKQNERKIQKEEKGGKSEERKKEQIGVC